MIVRVEEIPSQGLTLCEAIAESVLEQAALAIGDGLRLVGASPLSADFRRISGTIHVAGRFEVEVARPCRRCLKESSSKLPVEFSLRMVHEGARSQGDVSHRGQRAGRRRDRGHAAEPAGSFDLDEVDVEKFDGKAIDMDPIVREQFILAVPGTALCSEDCRGLCRVCGADLNAGSCGHEQDVVAEGRFQALANLKAVGRS
jgi:uncharacterized protein